MHIPLLTAPDYRSDSLFISLKSIVMLMRCGRGDNDGKVCQVWKI